MTNFQESDCIIKKDCIFYQKDTYNREEIYFYADYCLRGGEGCGMKKNYDLSERVKERERKSRLEK